MFTFYLRDVELLAIEEERLLGETIEGNNFQENSLDYNTGACSKQNPCMIQVHVHQSLV